MIQNHLSVKNLFTCRATSCKGIFSDEGKMKRGDLRLLVLVIIFVLYLTIGAGIFSTIEGPRERREVAKLRQSRDEFLRKHPCIADVDLEAFIVEITNANEMGISPLKNVSDVPSWGFGSAFFFAGTVVTTIGYGNVAPLSTGGKVFCIVFALFGIPMTAIMLTAFVERLLLLTESAEDHLAEKLHVEGVAKATLKFVHLCMIMLVLFIIVLIIPSLGFMYMEEWSYFEAFYFCFISLTTIGLGDFVPGDDEVWMNSPFRSLYKVFCVFYYITGLSFIILLLELCAKVPDDHPGMLFSCHQPFIGKYNEDEDECFSDQGGRYTPLPRSAVPRLPSQVKPNNDSPTRRNSKNKNNNNNYNGKKNSRTNNENDAETTSTS